MFMKSVLLWILIYVYEYFACIHVRVPCACLLPCQQKMVLELLELSKEWVWTSLSILGIKRRSLRTRALNLSHSFLLHFCEKWKFKNPKPVLNSLQIFNISLQVLQVLILNSISVTNATVLWSSPSKKAFLIQPLESSIKL